MRIRTQNSQSIGGETSDAWSQQWLDRVKAAIDVLRPKDLLVVNFGYGLGTIDLMPEKYGVFTELFGSCTRGIAWGVGTAVKEHRVKLIQSAYRHALNLGIERLIYWDFAPAKKELDIPWFATEGNQNGDPWCLVDYDGKPLLGYRTIEYFNSL